MPSKSVTCSRTVYIYTGIYKYMLISWSVGRGEGGILLLSLYLASTSKIFSKNSYVDVTAWLLLVCDSSCNLSSFFFILVSNLFVYLITVVDLVLNGYHECGIHGKVIWTIKQDLLRIWFWCWVAVGVIFYDVILQINEWMTDGCLNFLKVSGAVMHNLC